MLFDGARVSVSQVAKRSISPEPHKRTLTIDDIFHLTPNPILEVQQQPTQQQQQQQQPYDVSIPKDNQLPSQQQQYNEPPPLQQYSTQYQQQQPPPLQKQYDGSPQQQYNEAPPQQQYKEPLQQEQSSIPSGQVSSWSK
jgi:hypothetical protein